MLNTLIEFREYCLRKLGQPVIQINLDVSQIDDAIEDAILKFVEYHRDGYEEHYFTYQMQTDEEAALRKIVIPPEVGVDDVVEVIKPGSNTSNGRFDTYAWQASAAVMSPVTGGWFRTSLTDYSMMTQRLADINAVLGEVFPFRFTKYRREINLDFKVVKDEVIAFMCYRRIDPRTTGNEYAWNDPWLKSYATALIKERWGNVLIKMGGVRLLGGVELNGEIILGQAKDEIAALEEELKKAHQVPPMFFVG